MEDKHTPYVLCISAADSAGGIGINTDIKTLEAHHTGSLYVHTAVIAQHPHKVYDMLEVPIDMVLLQLDAVLEGPQAFHAIKIGILPSVRLVKKLAERLKHLKVPIVFDISLYNRDGFPWHEQDALLAMMEDLIPMVSLITPNKQEAERLSGMPIDTLEDAQVALQRIAQLNYDVFVLIKGRQFSQSYRADEYGDKWCADILYHKNDFHLFEAPTVPDAHNIGSGDSLSAAIAAQLAKGENMFESIRKAKEFVSRAIKYSPKDISTIWPQYSIWES